MSEKLFILCQDDLGNYEIRYGDKVFYFIYELAPILNEQQETITKLQIELELENKKSQHLLHKYFQLRNILDKIPPKIKEVWLNE